MRKTVTFTLAVMFAVAVFAGASYGGTKNKRKSHTVMSDSGQIRSCEDMQVWYDDDEVVRGEEDMNFTAAAGELVSLSSAHNGGVRVQGYDGNEFQVRACKTARSDQALLDRIKIVRNGNNISVEGPADEDDWSVQLLVKAPRNAKLSMRAQNGPLSANDLTGSLTARTVNGPVSLENVRGNIDVQAKNGPISVERSSGTIKLDAQNGPIDVSLSGREWASGSLDATTQNGPISMKIPEGYSSGVEVRTSGHSPIRCKIKGCSLQQDENDEFRILRLGGNAEVRVRASTENGPVEIASYTGNFD
jgi:hypothetical protein